MGSAGFGVTDIGGEATLYASPSGYRDQASAAPGDAGLRFPVPSDSASSRLRLLPILATQAVGLACGIIGLRINSHLLPPEVLGVYGVFLTFAPVGAWVVHAGIAKYLIRYWAGAEDRPALARQAMGIWARRLPWLLGAALVGGGLLMPLIPGEFTTVTAALLVAMASLALVSLVHAALQAERAHGRDFWISGFGSLSRTLFAPLWFAISGGVMASLWWGFGLHALTTALLGLGLMRHYARSPATTPPPIPTVYQGPLFVLLALATWALLGVNRWIVAGFFGETEAGYFTLASSMAAVGVTMINNAWVQYVRPGLFALGDTGRAADRAQLPCRTDRIALIYTLVAGGALVIIIHLAPWLLGWLIDPRYATAFRWLLPAGCFAIALNTMHIFHLFLLAAKCERASARPELISSVVLITGGVITAAFSIDALITWLVLSPLVVWTLTRGLARRAFRNRAA